MVHIKYSLSYSYHFPGRQFGDCGNDSKFPLFCTAVGLFIQNAVLTYAINSLTELFGPNHVVAPGFPPLPLIYTMVIAIIVACASMPHYLFAGQPFPLFAIAAGHDTVQLTAAIFLIYLTNMN